MALTDANGGLSAADVAAVTGNGNSGFGLGGDGAWFLLILFLFALGNGGWGNGFGGNGGTYMVDSSVQRGFDQSAVMSGISGLQSALTNGFADAAVAQCNQTTAMMQGFNGLQAQIASEGCADRAAVSNGVRDIIENQNRSVQLVLDKLCQQEIDALKAQNAALQTQLNMQNLATSQATQTAQLIQDNNAQTAALIQRIAPYPVPSYNVANPYVNNSCGCYNNSCGNV